MNKSTKANACKERVATSASDMEIEVPTNNETVSLSDNMTIFGQIKPGTPVGVTTMSFLKNLVISSTTADVNDIINDLINTIKNYSRYSDASANMSKEHRLEKVIEIAREFAEFHDTIADIKKAAKEDLKVVGDEIVAS